MEERLCIGSLDVPAICTMKMRPIPSTNGSGSEEEKTLLSKKPECLKLESAMARSCHIVTSASRVQAILLPQPPKSLGLQACAPRAADFVFLIEKGFLRVGQAGLELPTSGDPPTLASQSAQITESRSVAQPGLQWWCLCSPQPLPPQLKQFCCLSLLHAGTTGTQHHTWLIFIFFSRDRVLHVGQAGLELLAPDGGLTLSPGWTAVALSQLTATSASLQCSGVILVHHSLDLLSSSNPPTLASEVAGTIGVCHHVQLIFLYFLIEIGQGGLTMLPRLISSSWVQIILPPCPPKVPGYHDQPENSSLYNGLRHWSQTLHPTTPPRFPATTSAILSSWWFLTCAAPWNDSPSDIAAVDSAAEPETMAKPAQGAKYRGSIHDFPGFDPNQDAEALYTAMKGFGSDKEAILDIITSRSNRQRQEVCQSYKSLYGKDLIDNLKYELTGKFERLIVGLMRPPAYCDAKEIKDAISGIGTDEKCLIEILASRTNEQMHQLVAAYKDAYERDLEADIIGDTSGHFQKMLVVLLQGTREDDDVVSEDLVQQDVQDLYEAGELKWGTDEAQFIYILGNRSKQHLRLVFDEYLKTTGKPIEASIRGELSGDFEKLMLAVVKCIRSTPEYFAERLFKAMKGLGTRDNTLIRIMVSRSELDMLDIREIFRTKYEKSLYSMIKNDTSGEYKKTLLKLCGGDDDAAGQFFPEAAQVAYQMWELSAVARVELKGTVRPANDFNPDADAKALRKAMKGLGTDEDTIIDIITHRSNAQRQQIRQTFKSHFGRDLMADLKSEISGDLARLILGLMMPPAHYDAKQLKKAMEGAGTDEKALIEILATRTNAEIRAINEAYKEDYHKSLEDAISSDTSGHFRRILISLATGNREEGGENLDQAREDAQVAAEILEIADTPSGDKTSLETRFMTILCTRSYPHLRRVFQEFIKMTNYDVEHTIKKEMSGDVRDTFVAIVQSVKNKPLFFADKLYKSMKGAGTDEKTLTRIMVSRSEIDLFNIRREFIEKYDKSLHQAIEGDTSGDFLKALLALCGGED
ncbi:Annexin A6 [Plecturocebus cupreus]